QELLEDFLVPETWFFRAGAHLALLVEHVRGYVQRGRGCRLLSVPCSTGEEPYSLALALDEAGLFGAPWTLLAVDLSARSLAGARGGVYYELSFRQTPAAIRERYFRPREHGWELERRVRERVEFRQGNLVDPGFLAGEAPFDLIVCRNLFIYLHPEA